MGPTTIQMQRARIKAPAATTVEWQSTTVRRYQRRTVRVDEAILGVYLAGTNTRRIKGALAPLLRNGPLSKGAVSRLVGRLREDLDTWRSRDLAEEDIRYVFLDGWFPKVRIGGRRARVPVLVTLGVRADGQRVILDLRLAGEESAAGWGEVVASLVTRHLRRPTLAVIDGNPGLAVALLTHWRLSVQRCTAHKLRHLEAKAPARLREAPTEDYRRMSMRRPGRRSNRRARGSRRSGDCAVPPSSRASRRPATSCSPSSASRVAMEGAAHDQRSRADQRRVSRADEDAGQLAGPGCLLLLLFGLLRSGQVKLRALVGYQEMQVTKQAA